MQCVMKSGRIIVLLQIIVFDAGKYNLRDFDWGNVMKIKAKTRDCSLVVQIKTSFRENLDEKLLDNFSRVYLRGFLKVKEKKKNYVEFTGPIGTVAYTQQTNTIGTQKVYNKDNSNTIKKHSVGQSGFTYSL